MPVLPSIPLTELCPFCTRVARGEYEESSLVAIHFEPLNPVVPGHRLFLPRHHYTDASQAPFITGKVFQAASEHALNQGVSFNLITSAGSEATQTVPHLHVHYVPRHEGDGLPLPWTGQKK